MQRNPKSNLRGIRSDGSGSHEAALALSMLEGEGLMRLPQVLSAFPVGRSTWFAGIREGRYPQGVKLGTRCTAWRAADIRALIEKAGQ